MIDLFAKNKFVLHILFWVSIFLYQLISNAGYGLDFMRAFTTTGLKFPVIMLITYFNLYFLLPRYLLPKRHLPFFILFFISLFVASLLQRLVVVFLILPIYPAYCTGSFFNIYIYLFEMFSIFPVVALAAAIKLLRNWYNYQKKNRLLEKASLEAELKYLKTQIHPHFFFNTLNNLYALTLIKSDKAPEVVIKLSELMDYMLYECNTSKISVQKEMAHIKNYIALEKIRYGERLEITLNTSGDLENSHIAPMLMLPFLENSFKHGLGGELEKGWVHINLSVDKNILLLKIQNSKSKNEDPENIKSSDNGIGLKNVKRRLALLYKDTYDLRITDEEDVFTVTLKLNLS